MADIDGKNPNIVVTVRVRPETQEECNSQSYKTILRCLDERVIVFDPADPNRASGRGAPNNHGRSKDLKFGFDRVFDPYASQFEVFQHSTRSLINEVLSGFNCTCFAYGATGAGKTFTMIGNQENPGVMVLTMKELFATMQDRVDTTYDVSISYLEIYNETIRDLLVKNSKPLDLRESADSGVQVAGLSSHKPSSADEVLQLLEVGNSRRCQSATGANAQSSRSHAVLQICVEQRDRTANVSTDVKSGKLSLIDLAGSERASRTKTRGQQLVEGANINKSLLALGNCINALGQDYKEGKYVPYRNSKLTRLLKDSLGGNCKTVMIANVSPSSLSYEDTYNTLNYANRAKNIKTKVHTNQINVKAHVSEYKVLIDRLRGEIDELKSKLRDFETHGRSFGQDAKEKARIDEIRCEISRTVQDRQTVQQHLTQVQKREQELQDQKESAFMRIEDWQVQKWERTNSTRISGALGAAAEMKPPSSPIDIHQARRKLSELEAEERELKNTKDTLLRRLERNAEETKQILGHVPAKVASDMGRKQLERDLSIHWLELEKLNRDVEIRRQQATIRALQQQVSKAFQLLEIQNFMLEENGLITPGVQERYNSLMLTPSRSRKRDVGKFADLEPQSPFAKLRSPIVCQPVDLPEEDLPGLVSVPDEHDDTVSDLNVRFACASSVSINKENRPTNIQTSAPGHKAVLTKPAASVPAPRGRFGFASATASTMMRQGTGLRKTPSKGPNPSLLQLRRKAEDRYPTSFSNLARDKQPNSKDIKTPVRSNRTRWLPVSGKKAGKSVRFADESATEESTPVKAPVRNSGFPAIPTPTSISAARLEQQSPTRLQEEPNAHPESQSVPNPPEQPQTDNNAKHVDISEPSDEHLMDVPEPPANLKALFSHFMPVTSAT